MDTISQLTAMVFTFIEVFSHANGHYNIDQNQTPNPSWLTLQGILGCKIGTYRLVTIPLLPPVDRYL
jgi:hypothetical protein